MDAVHSALRGHVASILEATSGITKFVHLREDLGESVEDTLETFAARTKDLVRVP